MMGERHVASSRAEQEMKGAKIKRLEPSLISSIDASSQLFTAVLTI
jgi:hypothetical protein